MQYSKYNIFSQIKESDNYFIVNLLSGSADILLPNEAQELIKLRENKIFASPCLYEFIEKGYWVEPKEESKQYKQAYLNFIDERDKDEIQLFFVPTYNCNFACTYCYQDDYKNLDFPINNELIDSFFNYIKQQFAGRKKYITIFGGEPLLNSAKQKSIIKYLIDRSNEFGIQLCFVTNGYSLNNYIDLLKTAHIREIQVTLDGTEKIHNSRRFLKGGNGTFINIVKGIDACLSNNININLRVVVDKENIDNLPELAKYAIDKGWTNNPLFKTQIGRNYELHHCQSSPEKLFDRISLYQNIFNLTKTHPYLLDFYKPAYSISKFLWENKELPNPLFDSCPACKTEWAFDYTSNIYSCTATVGKTDESLGTFYPQVILREKEIEKWQERDITEINECKDCSVQLACGGGCGSVAKNKTGKISSPDCRPVKKLLELGFAAYFENNKN